MNSGIDFVITWVSDRAPSFQEEKAKYLPEKEMDDSRERYRDFGLLPYLLRGVEKYAPWVRRIYLIVTGEVPQYLNLSNEKLQVVKQQEYLPKEICPCYNSNVLELYLHKLPGLSERFVYFNDDMFLLKAVAPEDFFQGDKVCDMVCFQPVIANPGNPVMPYIYLNNLQVLAKYFEKRKEVQRNPHLYFHPGYPFKNLVYNALEMMFPQYTGLYTVHGPSPFFRQTFEELWEKEGEYFTELSAKRFRSRQDVSQYLFREWQKLQGKVKPKNLHKVFAYCEIAEDNQQLLMQVVNPKKAMLCINDTGKYAEEEKVGKTLREAFEKHFPEKSGYEK